VSAVVRFILNLLPRTVVNGILNFPETMQFFPMVGMAVVFEICCRRDECTYSQQRDSGVTLQEPLRGLGKPEEIVKITLLLSSAESSYFNGTTIVTDRQMTGYHPVGFPDLIAVMMKKKGSEEKRELTSD
jgi:hypothetical protein